MGSKNLLQRRGQRRILLDSTITKILRLIVSSGPRINGSRLHIAVICDTVRV